MAHTYLSHATGEWHAGCARCGWHSYGQDRKDDVKAWEELHAKTCPAGAT